MVERTSEKQTSGRPESKEDVGGRTTPPLELLRGTPSPSAHLSGQMESTFNFLQLPAELRNRVYECLFQGSTTTIRPPQRSGSTLWTFGHKHANASPHEGHVPGLPALLATNKQLRHEAIGIFYACTRWTIYDYLHVKPLLRTLSPERVPLISGVCYRVESRAPETARVRGQVAALMLDGEIMHWGLSVDEKVLEIEVVGTEGQVLWTRKSRPLGR